MPIDYQGRALHRDGGVVDVGSGRSGRFSFLGHFESPRLLDAWIFGVTVL